MLLNQLIVVACVRAAAATAEQQAESHSGQGGALIRGTTSNRWGEITHVVSVSLSLAIYLSFLDSVGWLGEVGCVVATRVMKIQSDQRSTPSNQALRHTAKICMTRVNNL